MSWSRRSLLSIAGISPLVALPADAPRIENRGLQVTVAYRYGEWHVCVPVIFDGWMPGMPVMVEWRPVNEYLAELKAEFYPKET